VAPIPRLDRMPLAMRERHRRQRVVLEGRLDFCGLPYLLEELSHGPGRSRHAIDEGIVRVALVAMKASLLVAQGENLARDWPIVVLARIFAPPNPRPERLFAQVAALGECEKRYDERARKRDDPRIGNTSLVCRFPRRCAQPVRQSGEI